MAVFAYNFSEMETVIRALDAIKSEIAESKNITQKEIMRLEHEVKIEYDRYQRELAEYERKKAEWNGVGTPPRQPSRAALDKLEKELAEARKLLEQLNSDAEALEEVKVLMEHTKSLVVTAEGEVLGYINTRLLDLRDFSTETGIAVANALGQGTTDSSYVKGANGVKYYAALYEDFKYTDYKALADKIGVPLTLAIMGANGLSTETGMSLRSELGKDYSYEQVKKWMQDSNYIDVTDKASVSAAAGAGDMGVLGFNALGTTIPLLHAEVGMTNTGETDQVGGLTVDFSKTTYMSYSKVNSSWQYAIREDKFENGGYTYIDENGLYRSAKQAGVKSDDDYYIVAMGNGFPTAAAQHQDAPTNGGANMGYTCQVTLQDSNGNTYTIDVLVGDTKGATNSLVPHDHPIEFIVNGTPNSEICSNGNVNYTKLIGSEGVTSVTDISVYENGARYEYTEYHVDTPTILARK